jgi:transposase
VSAPEEVEVRRPTPEEIAARRRELARAWAVERCPEGWRPMDRASVAEALGVGVRTVDKWLERPATGFPEPALRLPGGPVWFDGQVLAWLRTRVDPRTGRPLASAARSIEEARAAIDAARAGAVEE